MRIAVFCGASPGVSPFYLEVAEALGRFLAREGVGVVYGGASVGLMGAMANAALAAGGEVVGVIPRALVDRELAHPGLSELRIVDSMHERKALMAALSDGFVALPGGTGTLEEIFEVWTWAQLGYHAKPCALLNAGGFYDHLIRFLDHAVAEGFTQPRYRDMLVVADSAEAVLAAFRRYEPPPPKWQGRR